jgi:alpha-D-xyloside xylohydrolase
MNGGHEIMNFFEKKGNDLIFRYNGEIVQLTPWGKNSLRLRAVMQGVIQNDSVALLEGDECVTDIVIKDERHATITNGYITASLYVQPWENALQITYLDQNGKTLLKEISNCGALVHKARYFKPLSGDNFYLRATFEANDEEKIYGMGQYQQEIMDLKGCNLELAQRNSQVSIPFYISSRGYGFLWHNPAIGEVHFGKNTTQWIAQQTKMLDYWITAGNDPAQIEEQFASVVGKAPMMPEHGLGFWQCKLRYYNEKQVLEIAREYYKRRIPVDVFVIDYYHWPYCGDWRFDEEFFPHPKEMIEELHKMGMETMVSIWPQVDLRSENYEEMKQQGLLVKSNAGVDVQMIFHGNNVYMDPTNPRTREYVWKKCKENYADLGINSFWLDEAEPGYTGYAYEQYRYMAGPVEEVGNIYPREYARLFYEGMIQNGQKNIVNLIRCAWVGSQRYGALVWSGDISSTYEDFRKQICAGIHMGLCGIPWWTTDIGGFHGGVTQDPDFRELFVRWFQFGTFCPVMRLHGCRLPGKEIYNQAGEKREWTGADNELWSFGEEIYLILVVFVKIREKMRDYTRSIMKEAHEKGTPVMRALFYEFPYDQKCWDITDEYMFGADILVAPVCHIHALKREVYLPNGCNWMEMNSHNRYEGGRSYIIDAPLEVIPVFFRNGKKMFE